MLLSNLPVDELDVQARGAVQHARLVILARQSGVSSAHTAIARFALARVIVSLEQHLEGAFRRPDQV